MDLAEISRRHDIVQAFAEDPTLRERLRNLHLRGAPHGAPMRAPRLLLARLCLSSDGSALMPLVALVREGLPDVERLTRKLERRKASLADLCQLYRASSRLPMMQQAFREHEGPHAALLVSRCAPCDDLRSP